MVESSLIIVRPEVENNAEVRLPCSSNLTSSKSSHPIRGRRSLSSKSCIASIPLSNIKSIESASANPATFESTYEQSEESIELSME